MAKKTFPFVFYTLLLVFLVAYLRDINFAAFNDIKIDWLFLGLSAGLLLITRYLSVLVWLNLLKNLGAKNLSDFSGLAFVYAKSWLGRYIPGTAPWILGKIFFASRHGISKNKLAVGSVLEGVLQIVVTMAIALALLAFDTRVSVISTNIKFLIIAITLLCIVGLSPPIFNRFISFVYKLVRKKVFPKEHYANLQAILRGALLFSGMALLAGLSLFFAAKAFYPQLGYDNLAFVMGAGSLAGALGMLAIFAPSGIGVRDGVYLVLLSIIMPAEIALVVTVAARLLGISTDVLFFGLSYMAKPKFSS